MNVPVVSHHSLVVRNRATFLASLTISHGAHRMLTVITDACLRRQAWAAGQERMAGMFGCSRRSIIRWHQELVEQGWIRVIRRGKKLTNVYRLRRHLWERLTGRIGWKPSPARQTYLLSRPLSEPASVVELDEHEHKKRAALALLARAGGGA